MHVIVVSQFFGLIFGDHHGYVALRTWPGGTFGEGRGPTVTHWYHWPTQKDDLAGFCLSNSEMDIYFIPALFESPTSTRAGNIRRQACIYADADSCAPGNFAVEPTVIVETSPGRHHLYWVVTDNSDSEELCQVGRSIAYQHADQGCDRGGWDAGQLLRVPDTTNNKPRESGPFIVKAYVSNGEMYQIDNLREKYPPIVSTSVINSPMPPTTEWPPISEAVNSLYHHTDLMGLYSIKVEEPVSPADPQRHRRMWRFLCEMSRRGFDKTTAMVLAWNSGCNKYAQEGRPPEELWKELCKAYSDPENAPVTSEHSAERAEAASLDEKEKERTGEVSESFERGGGSKGFLSDEERAQVPTDTIVDQYVEWGAGYTDAAPQYHRAGIMTVLSAVFGEYGIAPTKFRIGLNLWFMILGSTTRSRKSTSQHMWLSLIHRLEDDKYSYDLASNTTPEALIDELLDRHGQSSIFHRDEVHGLMSEQAHKRYLTGLKEDLTALYDGKVPKKLRVGRATQRSNEVRTVFIMNFTGITEDVTDHLTTRDFGSGYLARFLFVTAEPPKRTKESEYLPQTASRESVPPYIVDRIKEAREFWDRLSERGNPEVVRFSDEAWERWNQLAWDMGEDAQRYDMADIMEPVSDRLAKSVMKVACLIAMSEQHTTVQMRHLLKAIELGEEWYRHMVFIAAKVRESFWQKQQDEILVAISGLQDGLTEAQILRKFRGKMILRDIESALDVLQRAGYITRWQPTGKAVRWIKTQNLRST